MALPAWITAATTLGASSGATAVPPGCTPAVWATGTPAAERRSRLKAASSCAISASEAARARLLCGVVSASGLVKPSVPTPATCTTCGWSRTLALSTCAPTGRSCCAVSRVRSISPEGVLAFAPAWLTLPPPRVASSTRPSATPATASATSSRTGPRAKSGVRRGISLVTSPISAPHLSVDDHLTRRLTRSRRQLEYHSLTQAPVAVLQLDVQPPRQLVHDRDARRHEAHALGVQVDAGGHLVAAGSR